MELLNDEVDTQAGYVVFACMIIAGLYLFFEAWPKADSSTGISKLFPVVALAVGMFFFNKHFIDKSKVKQITPEHIGPSDSYVVPPEPQYDLDQAGNPIQRHPFPFQGRR